MTDKGTVGPIIGSYIIQSHLGWRWTAWITMIMSAFFTIALYLITPETCEHVLLKRKAQRLRHERQDWCLHAESETQNIDIHQLVTKY